MGASKTTTMLEMAHKAVDDGRTVVIMQPAGSERSEGNVYTHAGPMKAPDGAILIASTDVVGETNRLVRLPGSLSVFIDEVQFMGTPEDVITAVQCLVDANVTISLFGLWRDVRGQQWPVSEALSSNGRILVQNMYARCSEPNCRAEAAQTMRRQSTLTDHTVVVQVGGMEMYAPMCDQHFVPVVRSD